MPRTRRAQDLIDAFTACIDESRDVEDENVRFVEVNLRINPKTGYVASRRLILTRETELPGRHEGYKFPVATGRS